MKILKNQDGFAVIITVVVVTMAILTSLTMTYIYSTNRLRYHARIKDTYKLINASESAAKIIKTIWDRQVALNPPGTLPSAIAALVAPLIAALPVTVTPLPTDCVAGQIEVPDPDGGFPFCFTYAANQQINSAQIKSSPLEKFLAKLVYFYEGQRPALKIEKPTFIGWLLNEKKAMAAAVNFAGAAPACAAAGIPGCAYCRDGAGNAAMGACSILRVCPPTWAECAVGGAGVTQAFRISTGSIDTY